MKLQLRDRPPRFFFGLFTLAPIILLAGLLLLAPPDGSERTQFLQFLGRFHPISVHLPIALLILAPLIEVAGRSRYFPHLLPAANFVLGVAICGAIAAATLGWCLGRAGGYSGTLIGQHMWAGVSVAAAAWLCWFLRGRSGETGLNRTYLAALIGTVGLVSFAGYRGGQLSQGENHLTEFMPAPFNAWLATSTAQDAPVNSPNGGPSTLYGAHIQPILARNCITCHGRSKHKSNLRLDHYEAALRGGKHGPVIKPGDPKGSDLLRRISLPSTDDDAMPPDNRRPLSASEIKIIEQWIAAGASGTQPADAASNFASASVSSSVPEVTFEEIDAAAVTKERASLAATVARLQQRLPNVLDYQSRSSSDIVVNAAWMGAKFGDNELAALAPLAERIVIADFSGTGITDKSSAAIAAMKRLRTLRLTHTKVTDATVQALEPLQDLESVGLFATAASPAALPSLGRMAKLRHIYVGKTEIASASAIPEEMRSKLIF